MICHLTIFETRGKSLLVRYVIEVLVDFINYVKHFFNMNKLLKSDKAEN